MPWEWRAAAPDARPGRQIGGCRDGVDGEIGRVRDVLGEGEQVGRHARLVLLMRDAASGQEAHVGGGRRGRPDMPLEGQDARLEMIADVGDFGGQGLWRQTALEHAVEEVERHAGLDPAQAGVVAERGARQRGQQGAGGDRVGVYGKREPRGGEPGGDVAHANRSSQWV